MSSYSSIAYVQVGREGGREEHNGKVRIHRSTCSYDGEVALDLHVVKYCQG